MSYETRSVPIVLAQTAGGWPASDAGWTTRRDLRPVQWTEGQGLKFGSCELVQQYGAVMHPGQEILSLVDALSITGHYCRILVEDDSGSVSVSQYPDTTFRADWYGYIDEPEIAPDGNAANPGGTAVWRGTGILGLLGEISCFVGQEIFPSTNEPNISGAALPFNSPWPNRKAAPFTYRTNPLLTGSVWSRINASRGTWRLSWAVEALLYTYCNPTLPYYGATEGPAFDLSSVAEDHAVEPTEIYGRKISEVLAMLCGQRRGMTWRLDNVDGLKINLEIISTATQDVSVSGYGHDAPTSTAVDLDGDVWISRPRLRVRPSLYDGIFVYGTRPFTAITLFWNSSDSDSSLRIPVASWNTSDTPGDNPDEMEIWRTWEVDEDWDCVTYGMTPGDDAEAAIRGEFYPDGGMPLGYPGYSSVHPPVLGLELDSTTPMSEGYGTSKDGQRQQATVYIGSATDGWKTLSMPVQCSGHQVTIGANAEDAAELKSELYGTGKYLLVTLGVHEWAPNCAVHIEDPSSWPRDLPRILHIDMPTVREHRMVKGAVDGVSSDGSSLETKSSETHVFDETDALRYRCAQAAAMYCGPSGSGQFSTRGQAANTYRPGDVLSPITAGGVAHDINAIVQMRRVTMRDGTPTTTWQFSSPMGGLSGGR